MTIQISVFSENRPGQLAKITKVLNDFNINIKAIKLSSSGDSGVVKFLVDKPELAYDKLKEKGITVCKNDIICILMKDKPGGLFELSKIFEKYNINIEDAYGFSPDNINEKAVLVVETDDREKLKQTLKNENLEFYNIKNLYK